MLQIICLKVIKHYYVVKAFYLTIHALTDSRFGNSNETMFGGGIGFSDPLGSDSDDDCVNYISNGRFHNCNCNVETSYGIDVTDWMYNTINYKTDDVQGHIIMNDAMFTSMMRMCLLEQLVFQDIG